MMLAPSNSPCVIVNTLLMLAQLARSSKGSYAHIDSAELYTEVRTLLEHGDASVRSKACNLVGNLCRHSAQCYPALMRHGILSRLLARLSDTDKHARKFACFAVGNVSFHNASAYEELQPGIHALVLLLRDEQEKTRANAAGALGNMVRNGDGLVHGMLQQGAIEALVHMVEHDCAAAPRRIGLFSLGNFAGHRECKSILMDPSLHFEVTLAQLSPNDDPTMRKYIKRIKTKISSH